MWSKVLKVCLMLASFAEFCNLLL